MEEKLNVFLEDLLRRYPILTECRCDISSAYSLLEKCFSYGHKLLVVGNGGSCSDGKHIVGELMKGFKKKRKCSLSFSERLKTIDNERGSLLTDQLQETLETISLNSNSSLETAFANDVKDGGLSAFAQQVYGYGKCGDVILCISTSGNSENIIRAAIVAKALEMKVLLLTGKTGGKLASLSDVAIKVPLSETFLIQEMHLPIYHCLCLMLEEHFYKE